ncbi:FtsK/SpoIIIE domain-containing protein [Bacillus toyonensis]|uniref:FtsK/SpoIIIE domain-containing protein n=1 Tax=Bacillus toyonensis TaxID=155322 RepID=UPI000BFA2685|nr:FtsK/SpoIIIE domain-containing protein [Bacillus toyonensis]PGF05117.1 cell division protein FtsK [Bacillus toyonensis]
MSFDSRNFVSDDDLAKERQDRQDRQNPPSVEHGQGGDAFADLNIDDLFSTPSPSSPTDNNNSFNSFGDAPPMGQPLGGGNDPFLNPIGGIPPMGGMNQPPTPFGQQPKTDEEKIMDAGKKSWSFIKDLGSGFHDLKSTPTNWSMTGRNLVKMSAIAFGLSFATMMIFKKDVMDYMMGSGFTAIAGVLLLSFNNDKARLIKGTDGEEEQPFDINKIEGDPLPQDDIFASAFATEPNMLVNLDKPPLEDEQPFATFEDEEDEGEEDDDGFDDGWDEFDEEEDEEFDEEDEEITEFVTVDEAPSDIATVLTEVDQVPAGMYTRHFLYENYKRALTSITPSYSETIFLDEDEDDEWDAYSRLIREVQQQMDLESGVDDYESDLSEILSVEKRLLTVYVEATRPKKLKNSKIDEFNRELSNIVSRVKGRLVEGRYSQTIAVGNTIYITIFTGETASVSVKDAIIKEQDFFLNTDNRIPVVMGFNELGDTIKIDLYDVESILTAGMPRGGKTFSVKTVMSQMVQFCSPSEVTFYFADVKGKVSDWYQFRTPHVRRFESDPQQIITMLTHLTDVEGPRREKIMAEVGVTNLKDYNQVPHDIELPMIYVVIDEMATLMQKLTDKDKKLFHARMVDLVTKMPGFGLRLWGIPHLVKNDIIPKTVSDLIPCKISVKGDESHVEATTGAKPSKFKFKLSHVGDCAVNMPAISSDVFFMHSFILAKNGTGVTRVLDYQSKLWEKLEPDSVKGSLSYQLDNTNRQKVVLDKLDLPSEPVFGKDGMY